MRVQVTPHEFSVVPGEPTVITVSVANTGSLISGHRIRILGLDARWVSMDQEQLSLFPDTAGVAVVTITLPRGVPAGRRTVAVEVTELTPPGETATVDLELTVPAEPGLRMAVDPVSVTGGSRAAVAVLVDNTGNAPLDVVLDGHDEASEVRFRFDPNMSTLGPGEQRIGTAHLRAPRPWFGSPKIRTYSVTAGPPTAPVMTTGSWVQKARLTRGALALTGLLAAATVFAVVVAVALSQVVSNSNADRNLALQVAQASQSGNANAGTAGISGTVRQQSTQAPVGGVTVQIFQATNTTTPIVSTATGASGTYHFSGLAAGSYKLQFQGAGFSSLWYPDSLTPDAATAVPVTAGQAVTGININIGGLPGVISGQVVGADPTGAVLTLEVPGAGGTAAAAQAAQDAAPVATAPPPASGSATTAPPATPASATAAIGPAAGSTGLPVQAELASYRDQVAPPSPGAGTTGPSIVSSQTLSASGTFTLTNVPSPGTFYLVVVKTGYAPAVQQVDLAGGEQRSGVVITLHQGDGSISGTVSTATGPLGGATIAASDGSITETSVSQTSPGSLGDFVLSNLPTPDTLTIVVTAPGFASQTLSLSLAAHQQLTGVAVALVPGTGSISGTVTTNGAPVGGVTVTATNGQVTSTTVSLSNGPVGSYQLTGLVVPGDYTVTFSGSGLTSQTRAVSLSSAAGNLTGVSANLVPNSAAVYGTVTQTDGQAVHQVTVELSSGSTTYQVMSADTPTPGSYEIDGVAPGTYTISFTRAGGQPTSSIITLSAGQRFQYSPVLTPAASIYGEVALISDPSKGIPGAHVTLYLASQYPTVSVATAVTDSAGNFRFTNVDAPQNFVVAVAYPQGSSAQETVVVQTSKGLAEPVCGSAATGSQNSTPSPSTSATTSATTSVPTSVPTSTPTSVRTAATCNPSADPLTVTSP